MKSLTICVIGLLLLAPGCSRKPEIMSGRMDRGLVIVLPGIEGRSASNVSICEGLAAGGVKSAVELYDWTSAFTPLLTPFYNERAEGRNRRKASELAASIVRYRTAHPDKPVILVGQSGGSAIAIWTVESLPPGVAVDGVILLAASLSHDYMLDTALAKTRRGIVNFYSARDFVFLGIGTTVTGTMDGRHTTSAGRDGFDVPRRVGPNVYNRLFQIPWQKRMAQTGSIGLHLSSGAPVFVANYVSPFVLLPEWNGDIVQRVLHDESVGSILRSTVKPISPTTSRPAASSSTAASGGVGTAGPAQPAVQP